ncbi:hypothetical protein GGX14DRAFT_401701 [Mycena pura]|uniref:Uncharacterized protein n=1 Tax=Mycena pura TaxID=153505 RepID=A0AAD6V3N7_9AGAR|nr:hypothetical protein GGX14DRAFT_401701 [Mycena pura]
MMNHIVKYKSSPWQNIMKLEIHENCIEFHLAFKKGIAGLNSLYRGFSISRCKAFSNFATTRTRTRATSAALHPGWPRPQRPPSALNTPACAAASFGEQEFNVFATAIYDRGLCDGSSHSMLDYQLKGIVQHIEARSLLVDVTEWEPNDRVCANFMPNKLHVKQTDVVDGSALGGAAHSVLVEYRVFPAQVSSILGPVFLSTTLIHCPSVFLCEALLCNHGDTASSAAGAEFRSAALPSGRRLSTSSSMSCRRRYHGLVQCAEREPHPEGTQYTHGGTRPNGRTRTLASSVSSTGPSAANGVFFPVCFGRAAILMAPPKIVGVVETPDVVVGAVDPKRHVVTARGADQRKTNATGNATAALCTGTPVDIDLAATPLGAAVWRHAGPEERFPAEVRHTGEVDGAVARGGLKECGVEDANYGIICAIFRLCVRIAFLVRELSTRDTLAEDVCSGVRADARVVHRLCCASPRRRVARYPTHFVVHIAFLMSLELE